MTGLTSARCWAIWVGASCMIAAACMTETPSEPTLGGAGVTTIPLSPISALTTSQARRAIAARSRLAQ